MKPFLYCFIIIIITSFNAMALDEQKPTAPSEEYAYKDEDFTDTVMLKGLNKVTARVSSFNISKEKPSNFGNLEISLLKCWKSPPEEEPENKALLRIWEQIPGENKKEIFYGWMFSSSPALSSLEHPVYDITVVECTNSKKAE